MKEGGGGGDGGFVRADQIDLKSLDEQLERHLSRAWTMEKCKEEAAAADRGPLQHRRQRREDWEVDPAKLVVRGVIARGTFGTVHRGVYDGHDVAAFSCKQRISDQNAHTAVKHIDRREDCCNFSVMD